ncbi:helix-turn-helix transcriptional regulator [Lentzea sp. CC55]|uniref:helix-turn-helix domain-containing protein n=1 Tax=Lentzea sp. CC55 TaxID=2884909 RepID=UPI001F192738|nr:helix-turn-helix transcriptional regulator [Lentzea sp. CC55]MCG8921964.1 helix-turn-helix transcriptional regulator [Lentzea sp. CC55]
MTAITSTAYSRDLGDELRRLREKFTSLTGHAFAEQLGWDPSKVSNIEKGKARASEIDLVQYLMMCGRDSAHFEAFRERYRYAFDPYVLVVPDNLRTLAMAEAQAQKITSYDVLSVPGLVQIPGYARALLETGRKTPMDVEKSFRWRMDRQAVLRRPNPPECRFYVHELALQLQVGDERIMEEQYLRMLFNTHIVRIVPMSAGPGPIRMSPRMLLSFEKLVPLAYSETDLARVFAHDGAAIADSREFFKWLDSRALDEGQSKSLLTSYISRLRRDPHEPPADLAQEHLQRS